VVQRNLRLNVEADSLNCAVLGLDAKPGTEEFDLFVREVVREMTAKAGPEVHGDPPRLRAPRAPAAATEALHEALAGRPVGDPRDPATRMGALVDTAQRDAVARRSAGWPGEARSSPATRTPSSTATSAAPSCSRCCCATTTPATRRARRRGLRPVATLLPYDSAAEVVELMALGQGSLVGSVVSHDPAFVRDVVLGAAGHHGRLHVLDRDSAGESTGHGSPLPHLVHGGPGRAGGREELGGMRGVRHFLQRTAVQGSPDMLTAITGVYTPGAARGWRPRSTPSASR
jgi:oxepin-CoA hydrolase/3-oxo-5,6-dehydrosuberyl-CoA semialdehyde dehydrogenase